MIQNGREWFDFSREDQLKPVFMIHIKYLSGEYQEADRMTDSLGSDNRWSMFVRQKAVKSVIFHKDLYIHACKRKSLSSKLSANEFLSFMTG